jgi:hypothetical protein
MPPELENETPAAAAARRSRRLRQWLAEAAFGGAFLLAAFGAGRIADIGGALSIAAVAVAIAVLTAWFAAYIAWHRRLDEFGRALDLRAVALAGVAVIWFTTAWGLAETFLRAPDLPIVLLAPLAAFLYAVIRAFAASTYR